MTNTIKNGDIFEIIGPLLRKLTETSIAHQTNENGAPYIIVCSDKYMSRYRIQLDPSITENLLMGYMIAGCIQEHGREAGLIHLKNILLGCFTHGEINDLGIEIVRSVHLEYLHDDLAKQVVH